MNYKEALERIEPLDRVAMNLSKRRWDSIAKPLESLGKIEEGIIQIAGIIRDSRIALDKKALVIMCADNGVVVEGITQCDSEVTAIVSENLLSLNSCACIMAKQAGATVIPIDMGIGRDTKLPTHKKVAYGTMNMVNGPAMTRSQAIQGIEAGIATALELKEAGYQILASGEMGIGNTTTSSAISAVLLGLPAERVTGKGAGLSNGGLQRKIEVIEKAIEINHPDKEDPIDVLSKVGGYDIAGLTGLYIGGAVAKLPVVIDGFISSVAALLAIRLEPMVCDYLLPSHVSKEAAGKLLLDAIGMKPYITCDMSLGEGTGAVSLFPLLDMGLAVYNQMSTFEQIKVEAYQSL